LIRVLPLLWLAFKAWMMVDAYRKRQPQYWYWVITVVPFGEAFYFFTVKIHDFKKAGFFAFLKRPPSLDMLRLRFRTTPSLENHLLLAMALADAAERAAATSEFNKILERWPEEPEALFGLGTVLAATGDPAGAALRFERQVGIAPAHRDWEGWRHLSEALWSAGRREESIEALRRLVRKNPRLDHEVLLAECLSEAGRGEEARGLIERAIEEDRGSPSYARRRNRGALSRGAKLLRKLRRVSGRDRAPSTN
jgi:hypothetical protein